jgi:hypothetical protein
MAMSRDTVTTAIDVAALALLAASGFTVAMWLGFLVLGLGLLILSWMLSRSGT